MTEAIVPRILRCAQHDRPRRHLAVSGACHAERSEESLARSRPAARFPSPGPLLRNHQSSNVLLDKRGVEWQNIPTNQHGGVGAPVGLTVFKTAEGSLGAVPGGFDSHTPLPRKRCLSVAHRGRDQPRSLTKINNQARYEPAILRCAQNPSHHADSSPRRFFAALRMTCSGGYSYHRPVNRCHPSPLSLAFLARIRYTKAVPSGTAYFHFSTTSSEEYCTNCCIGERLRVGASLAVLEMRVVADGIPGRTGPRRAGQGIAACCYRQHCQREAAWLRWRGSGVPGC